MMRIGTLLGCFTVGAFLMAACHDSTGPGPSGTPNTLRFSGAANQTDTVGAVLKQALLIEVRDSTGALAPAGTVVRFTAVYGSRGPELYIAPLTSPSYGLFSTSTTDARGQTSMLVQLGAIAGPARVVVDVPTLGLEDTARFTVNPGNPARVTILPADTLLYVGKSYSLRGGVVDRFGNSRTDPVTWSTSGPGVTVSGGGVVTAAAIGRYFIIGSGTWGTDSGAVSVVPQSRLAAFTGNYGAFIISTVDADGSNPTALATGFDGGIGAHPAWIPGTNTVVYTTVVGSYQTLYTVGANGTANPFFTTPPPHVTHEAEPTPSADGKWLYFTAFDDRCSAYDYCVSRSKIDGSSPELIVPTPSRNPSPSPDGSKVAYTESGGIIKVFDVATATASSWSVGGTWPAWSPDGTQIAYRNATGMISFVAPDGTPGKTLTSATATDLIRGWSPDGKWLLVSRNGIATLVDPVSGTALPLKFLGGKVATSMQ